MKLYSSAAVARWLDLTERRIRQLRDKGIIKEYRQGYYMLQETIHKYIHYLRGENDGFQNLNYNTERAKLIKAKREIQELELQLRKNEVHTSEDVKLVMTDMLVKFKTRIMAVPAKASPILAKKTDQTEIFKILKQYVDEALEELSRYGKTFEENDNIGDKEDTEAN
ncbi:MAG: hypothetical protein Q4D26_10320 [Clostridia bacterium]|nr:hypothetical protein [Clostridia bacterium]